MKRYLIFHLHLCNLHIGMHNWLLLWSTECCIINWNGETWRTQNWNMEVLHGQIMAFGVSLLRFLLTTVNPGVNKFAFNGTEWKKMTNQDWRRLNLIYFKIECIFGLPLSVAPFPLAYMCPWLVILPLWSAACGWECTGRTGTCKLHDSMISFGGSWG